MKSKLHSPSKLRVLPKITRITGFTLVESLVAIVIMGIAMTMLIFLFFPRIENSGIPQYQVRASVLGQSMMNTILSRGFDEKSNANGDNYRCDERGDDGGINTCSTNLGPDNGETDASFFNDVDDYRGCWYTTEFSKTLCSSAQVGQLTSVLGDDVSDEYANFVVDVKVTDMQGVAPHIMRKIQLTVVASQFEEVNLTAFKGNY